MKTRNGKCRCGWLLPTIAMGVDPKFLGEEVTILIQCPKCGSTFDQKQRIGLPPEQNRTGAAS